MINWIEHWFAHGASYIAKKALAWIHIALHAIAGIIEGIIGNVRLAWQDFQHSIWYIFSELAYGARLLYYAIWWLLNRGMPYIFRTILAAIKRAETFATGIYHRVETDILSYYQLAERYSREFTAWFHARIVVPLANSLGNVWTWINRRGEYLWQLVTHPDRLADLVLAYTSGAILRAGDSVATALGEAVWRILTKQLHRILRIAEDILSAVM